MADETSPILRGEMARVADEYRHAGRFLEYLHGMNGTDDPALSGEDYDTPDPESGPYRLTVTFTADDILHAQLLASFMVMALRDRNIAYDAVVDGPVGAQQ